MAKSEDGQTETRVEPTAFDGLSRSYHEEMIKLHDRVQTLTGSSPKKDGKLLPIFALLISFLSLGIAGYNAFLNRDTQKKQILDTINELSKLTPPPPVVGKSATPASSSSAALSNDTNAYWLKIDQLATEINLLTKGTLAKRTYVTLIGTSLSFGDSKHARAFLQSSASSSDDDADSQIQLALEWAQLAEATKESADVSSAISQITNRPQNAVPNSVVEYQIHYDLADMYLLPGGSSKKDTVDVETAAAAKALALVDDPVAAERLKGLQADLVSRVDKRFPALPPLAKAKLQPTSH